MFYGMTR